MFFFYYGSLRRYMIHRTHIKKRFLTATPFLPHFCINHYIAAAIECVCVPIGLYMGALQLILYTA